MESIQIALENWKRILVVSEDSDILDPIVKKRLSIIDKNAEEALSSYDKNGKESLFLGRIPNDTDEMVKEFKYMSLLAIAWNG